MFKRSLLLGSILCLTSCAYMFDKQIQKVTVLTPGANDAVCYLHVDGLRHKLHPPESASISKSPDNMVVDCLAPGNRRRKVVIEPALSEHAGLNVFNGVIPGTSWDIASNSLYTYPDVIEVDFSSAALKPEELPAHNNPDIRQPEEYDLEEFTPALPRLNSDRNAEPVGLQRRGGAAAVAKKPVYTESAVTPYTGPGRPADKGDLSGGFSGVMDGLTTSTAKPAAPPVSQPVPPPAAPVAVPSPAAAPSSGVSIAPYPIQSKAPSSPAASAGPPAPETAGPPIPLTTAK